MDEKKDDIYIGERDAKRESDTDFFVYYLLLWRVQIDDTFFIIAVVVGFYVLERKIVSFRGFRTWEEEENKKLRWADRKSVV